LGIGLLLAACGTSTSSGTGTIAFAEGPGANPNWIFPYMSCTYFSVSNINQFEVEMYRPLYWFGLGKSTAVQFNLSTANAPKFSNSDKTVSFEMKGWKWSNGETVNAQSLMFFLNMYKADPTAYCGYNQGFGIPDQVSTVSTSGEKVTITFKKSVSPNWLLYNYLSELTPMPQAWDKTSTSAADGSGGCASGAYGAAATATACKAVEKFLDAQSANLSSYTGPLWQVVDGPWKLTKFDSLGNATFVPNTKYSGPQKAQVSTVELKAYTTSNAEESDLFANKLSIGFVDPSHLPGPAPAPGKVGPNIAQLKGKYDLITGSAWSFNYAPFNFTASDPKAPELKQLYIRQALQESMDQKGLITAYNKGYGFPTCNPIPPNSPRSISASVPCAYPYSLSGAKSLLTEHGWTIQNGVQTCTKPGTGDNQCGLGIPAGSTLSFSIVWGSGTPSLDNTLNAEIAAWKGIGIVFSHSEESFNSVVADCSGGQFQICMWGAGWVYAPDYYPSGETLFTAGGSFNPGGYSDLNHVTGADQMTTLINESVSQEAPLTDYAQYAAEQLPVLYEPNPTATAEYTVKFTKSLPPNPLGNFMPEYFAF
jgi:peptide/nickel transport system substrate-binding protein